MVKVMKSKKGKFVKIECTNGKWYVFEESKVEVSFDMNVGVVSVFDKSMKNEDGKYSYEAIIVNFIREHVLSIDYTFEKPKESKRKEKE